MRQRYPDLLHLRSVFTENTERMQTAVCTTFANARHKATQAQSNIYYSF
jgi:hypothetical protein